MESGRRKSRDAQALPPLRQQRPGRQQRAVHGGARPDPAGHLRLAQARHPHRRRHCLSRSTPCTVIYKTPTGAPSARWTTSCRTPASARCSTAGRSPMRNTATCRPWSSAQTPVSGTMSSSDNYDPNSQASVLSRGLVGSIGERVVVASPIYKQHFDLQTGECLEAPEHSVISYAARIDGGKVWVSL